MHEFWLSEVITKRTFTIQFKNYKTWFCYKNTHIFVPKNNYINPTKMNCKIMLLAKWTQTYITTVVEWSYSLIIFYLIGKK